MVHGRGCNPHRSTTTFANLEITSLWRHNSETIRDREKRRPPLPMKYSELSNGENRIALQQLLQNRKWCHWWRHNLGSRWKLQKKRRENFSIGAFYNGREPIYCFKTSKIHCIRNKINTSDMMYVFMRVMQGWQTTNFLNCINSSN